MSVGLCKVGGRRDFFGRYGSRYRSCNERWWFRISLGVGTRVVGAQIARMLQVAYVGVV